jgi:glycosyltransferase involved in cell wall biosynthesis
MRAEGDLLDLVPEAVRLVDLKVDRLRRVSFPFVRYLVRERPDAVLIYMWPLTALCAVLCRLSLVTSRVLVCDHNTLSVAYKHFGRFSNGRFSKLMLRASLAIAYRFAHARITVSRGVAEDLASLSGIPQSKFDVIYNPIVIWDGTTSCEVNEKSIWGTTVERRIIAVGSLKPQKNYPLLLDAFAKVCETRLAKLLILGDGPLKGHLERMVAARGLAGKVIFHGFTKNPFPYYLSADLFVLSSDYEGLPTVLVEALSCGLRVVSTDCPSGPREILADGRYGELVPCGDPEALADAMDRAFDGIYDAEVLKKRAREFEPQVAAKSYLAKLLSARTTASPTKP